MNHKQRFHATMHYQPRDRVPFIDFDIWPETLEVWRGQGLPPSISQCDLFRYFGMDYYFHDVTFATGTEMELFPRFEALVLEDRGDEEVVQQADGVRVLRKKSMGSIPQHLGHLLTDRESWRKHYLPRLDPSTPERMPADLAQRVAEWSQPDYPNLIVPWVGGLYGKIRDWMGLEQVSTVVYDDPAFFEEMVVTLADCIVGSLSRLLQAGARVDACAMWEDMCYNAGPLLSPRHFKRYLVPQYRRITDLLRGYGVDVIWVDCDGRIDKLIPLWMEGGVNTMFPVEIGSWGADPLAFRREYGRDLLLMGGFSKRILAGDKAGILKEIQRLTPLVEDGGYIPFCDHLVPPDVPLENYWFFWETVREFWGNGADMAPMGALA